MSEEIEKVLTKELADLKCLFHPEKGWIDPGLLQAVTYLMEQALQKRDSELLEWVKDKEEKCKQLKGSQYLTETPEYFDGKLAILGDITNKLINSNN